MKTIRSFTAVTATSADSTDAATLIGEAFADDAVYKWVLPTNRVERRNRLVDIAKIFVDHALAFGHIDRTDNAVALWLHHRAGTNLPEPPDYMRRLDKACDPYGDRHRVLDELLAEHQPIGGEYHHLVFLAVHPDHQNAGHGSALLKHHHGFLDQAGLSAYLEATSTGSRNLYYRYNYAPAMAAFCVPDGAPLWPLWRLPQPAVESQARASAATLAFPAQRGQRDSDISPVSNGA